MKILVSPDKFKGSLSAARVCSIIKKAINGYDKNIEVITHPLADGGDGSLDLLKNYINLTKIDLDVPDPLGRTISSFYFVSADNAFIELASASGYVLLKNHEKNPLLTSTRGTGQMIKDAIERGYKRITLFLGGSATNDAGTGILHELGFRFLDKNNNELYPMGKNLGLIHSFLYPDNSNYKLVSFNLLCDVDNPFYGPMGAARVYSPQKGATEKDVEILDAGLKSFADLILKTTGKDVQSISGAGAAGAVPGGLLSFLNSSILSGTDQFIQLTDYENRLSQVDCIITGEGCLDDQSLHGKLVQGVRKLAHKYNKNLYYLVGHCTLKNNDEFPSQNIYAITDYEKDHEKAMKNAEDHLQKMTLDFISNIQKHQK